MSKGKKKKELTEEELLLAEATQEAEEVVKGVESTIEKKLVGLHPITGEPVYR